MKRGFSVIGMISGIVIVVLGILLMAGVFGGDTNTASGAGYIYDTGYATFGADFYNYVSNNAAEAASASRTAANNLDEIAGLIRYGFGIFLIAFGVTMLCLFGGKLEGARVLTVQQDGLDEKIRKSVEEALEAKKELFVPAPAEEAVNTTEQPQEAEG